MKRDVEYRKCSKAGSAPSESNSETDTAEEGEQQKTDGIGGTNTKETSVPDDNYLHLNFVTKEGLCLSSLLSEDDYLKDLGGGFKSEENLRKPLTHFSTREMAELYPLIDNKSGKMYEMYTNLQSKLKIGVDKAIKKRKGVISIKIPQRQRNVNLKAYLLHMKSVKPPRKQKLSSEQPLVLTESLPGSSRKIAAPPKMMTKPVNSFNEERIFKASGAPSTVPKPTLKEKSTRLAKPRRIIQTPKRYSEDYVVVTEQDEQNANTNKKRKKGFEMGMLPPRFPMYSLDGFSNDIINPKSEDCIEELHGLRSSTSEKDFTDTGESLFQISALRLSGGLDFAELESECMENRRNTSGDNLETSKDFETEEVPLAEELAETDFENESVAPGNCEESSQVKMQIPCSAGSCIGIPGTFPDMQCIRCLCMFHEKCMPLNILNNYVCSECQSKEVKSLQSEMPTMQSAAPVPGIIEPKLARLKLPEEGEIVRFKDIDITMVPLKKGHIIVTKRGGGAPNQRMSPKVPPTGPVTLGRSIMREVSVQQQHHNIGGFIPIFSVPGNPENLTPAEPNSLTIIRLPSSQTSSNPIRFKVTPFQDGSSPRRPPALKSKQKLQQSPSFDIALSPQFQLTDGPPGVWRHLFND